MGKGFDKYQETKAKILGKVSDEKSIEKVDNKVADALLAQLASSPMAEKFKANASRGSENLGGGKLPLLKIFQTGKSEAVLANGEEPKNGWLFYQPTQQEFESIKCHILSISKGYYAKPMKSGDKPKYTQLMAGVILDKEEMKPFVMYLTGLKLNPVWGFTRDEVSVFTHAKPVPIPMFCLEVKMSTVKVKTDYGTSHTLWLELSKDEKGTPIIVQDEGKFEFLNSMVDEVVDIMSQVIKLGTNEEETPASVDPPHPAETKDQTIIDAEEVFGAVAK